MIAEKTWEERNALYQSAEARVNRFDLNCFAVLTVLMLVTEGLNEIGLFTAEKAVMRLSAVAGVIISIT